MRRITQGLVLLLVLGLSVGLVSCGGDDDEDIAGTYVGTINDNFAGPGTLTVVLSQNGNTLVGNYTSVFNPGSGRTAAFGNGDLTGVINGSVASLTANPRSGSPCVFIVNANVDDEDITGTYASSNCPDQFGSINASRQ